MNVTAGQIVAVENYFFKGTVVNFQRIAPIFWWCCV